MSIKYLEGFEKLKYRSGKSSLQVFKEFKIAPIDLTFPIRTFSPFFEIIDEVIQRLKEAGICPDRLLGVAVGVNFKNKLYDEEIPALVLSMEDLGIGFQICLIPLSFSAVVFLLEVVYSKSRKMLLLMTDYIAALFTVLTFIKIGQIGK